MASISSYLVAAIWIGAFPIREGSSDSTAILASLYFIFWSLLFGLIPLMFVFTLVTTAVGIGIISGYLFARFIIYF